MHSHGRCWLTEMAYTVALGTTRGIMTLGGARIAFRGSMRDSRGFATIGGELVCCSVTIEMADLDVGALSVAIRYLRSPSIKRAFMPNVTTR